ncbi:dipeptidyl aminopeptidase BIII [Microbulbifer sp. NBRC 101763]|uniref:alpha/beta hydrolase family protein n=1 Tax=Microbulbifer sp. NBRC 101763 TaxID=1113820 RepID=UPI0030AE450A
MKIVCQLIQLALLSFIVNVGSAVAMPAETYFKPVETMTAQISPDGKFVASVAQGDESQKLVIWNSVDGSKRTLIDLKALTPRDASIRFIRWIGPRYIVAQFMELKKGVKNLLDTKPAYRLLVLDVLGSKSLPPKVFEVKTSGWLVHALPDEPGYFLYAKSGIYSKVYKIDVSKLNLLNQKASKLVRKDGGQFTAQNEVASVKGFAARWFFDLSGQPESALYFDEGKLHLSRIADGISSTPIKSWTKEELEEKPSTGEKYGVLIPVSISPEDGAYFCLDTTAEKDRTVYQCNFSTGEESVVYRSDSYDIVDLIIDESTGALIGVKVVRDGKLEYQYIDESIQVNDGMTSLLETTVGASIDNTVKLYFSETHDQPGRYFIRKQGQKSDQLVASKFPHLDGRLESRQFHDWIQVEGIDIPYVLNMPKGNGPYPLIVMPHGGPLGIFDHQYFDYYTQFFVANKYAVLRVNYRGSSGYSAELEEAGIQQWGNLMLEDIYQATKVVGARKDIASSQICAAGVSYGGYAALMMAIKHQQLFRCAVSIAGVTDVNLYLNSPYTSEAQTKWLQENVGDTVKNYDLLKDISPVYLAQELSRPVFIIHGEKDEVVDIEHMHRMHMMLSKFNKDYEWKVYPDMAHGPADSEHHVAVFSSIIEFIEKNMK